MWCYEAGTFPLVVKKKNTKQNRNGDSFIWIMDVSGLTEQRLDASNDSRYIDY